MIFGLQPEEKKEIGEFLKGDSMDFDLTLKTEEGRLVL